MRTLALLGLTAFISSICGAVILIKVGGWLATLSAILIICHYFISTSLIIILAAGAEAEKKKKVNEEVADS